MEKIKVLKEYWWLITTIAAIIGCIWSVFGTYQANNDKHEELVETTKTSLQMSLKSVIWNDKIPLAERASACDVYLNSGFNSLTKKECEVILENAELDGIF